MEKRMEVTQNALLQKELNRIDIRVLDLGYAKLDKRWHATRAKWTSSRIYMICSGCAMLRCGEQEICMQPGNIYMIPPGVPTDFWCDDTAEKFFKLRGGILISNFRDLASQFHFCQFSFVKREANFLAHRLAHLDCMNDVSLKWVGVLHLTVINPDFYD